MIRLTLSGAACALLLAGCGDREEPAEPVDPVAEAAAARAEPSPLAAQNAAPAPARPAATTIQTNTGPDGTQVDLTRVRVTGNVLTVELSYRPAGNDTQWVYLDADEVSIIDDATSQRYGVLRDDSNQWMAAPLQSASRDRLSVQLRRGQPGIVWFKFPAPPAGSPTVSINIPNVGPFDGVAVQR
ncbi:hypothetical protein [Phenylobacterium sp.]|uniref:hypothetical protein n=1 Tax=Phenylobacterium sp. TaxID=1871053 RepID=UPI0027317C39|nr:hypothetical protein [Phenylobacterium sp.]MDP1872936.1 hypothetical protein [Phenylobacterium sp.]MDP3489858.1 hypothetical protein [Phenylobacterium sp.]